MDVPPNIELAYIADLSWMEENKILLRNYIEDSSLGNYFMALRFKGDEVGVMMYKSAGFFMDDYFGFSGSVGVKDENI